MQVCVTTHEGFYSTTNSQIVVFFIYDENCSYLDINKKDRTSYLRCQNYGCCGDFKQRYCCTGPIPIVAGIFGGVLVILVIAVLVGVCYTKYKKKKHRIQPVPTITAEMYNDIPRPSPPSHRPPIYNPLRLHPPPSISQSPFRNEPPLEHELHPPPSNLHPPRFKATTRKHSQRS
ncbi:hypothetical protein ACF0H5_015004 [Mactra antiquata]